MKLGSARPIVRPTPEFAIGPSRQLPTNAGKAEWQLLSRPQTRPDQLCAAPLQPRACVICWTAEVPFAKPTNAARAVPASEHEA